MNDEARARALLDALVRESSPPPGAGERGLALVEARIVAGEDEPRARPRAPELLRAAVIAVAIAAAVLLVVRAGVWSVQAIADGDRSRDAASDEREPPRPDEAREVGSIATPPRIGVASDASPEPEPVAPRSAPARAAARVAPLHAAPSPETVRASDGASASDDTSDLAAEAALVRAAKAESDDRAALVLLDRHATSFPNGELARERELLRAERLCALGRVDEARALAKRFLADGRDDLLARRMRKVCPAP